jgi:hypothetical protein
MNELAWALERPGRWSATRTMSTSEPIGENPTDTTDPHRLPPAIGVDADGLVHRAPARFASEVLLTDGAGHVVTSRDLHGRDRETWVDYVADRRGWADCWLGERLTAGEVDVRIAEAPA